jgi:ethanolaminephosphotransferase
LMSNYITSEGDKHIINFKYRGKDLSITYEYLWSPLADKMLEFTPSNIAPNTLTLVGFLFNIVGTIVLIAQLPFYQDAPRWSLFFYAICVFIYQMLDNLDGKQARKIKNSTPLGMIMDHGCDALGVIALSAGMARVICLGS